MKAAAKEIQFVSYDTKPTDEQFAAYQNMFDYFNEVLFQHKLPNIILNFSRKNKNVGGFFAPERWIKDAVKVHEISLNPDHWKRGADYIASIFVHEMVHLWQQVYGKAPRSGYHNKEWGNKMKEVGLYPSNTGAEGGKETGQQMTHYVIPGGAYEVALNSMPKEYILPFQSVELPLKLVSAKNKVKYVCPMCDAKIWGKPDMHVMCLSCDKEFIED